MAVKYPDIDKIINSAAYLASKKLLNKAPNTAPCISIGRKIPPATPEVNDIRENSVLIKYRINKNAILNLFLIRTSTKLCPLPRTIG